MAKRFNRGRRRAKVSRKIEHRKDRKKDEEFGTLVVDSRGNKRIVLD